MSLILLWSMSTFSELLYKLRYLILTMAINTEDTLQLLGRLAECDKLFQEYRQ